MAAVNYYIGLKRGASNNPGGITATTATVGTAVDVELRMQTNDGSTATGLTRLDVIKIMETLEAFIAQGGLNGAGANLPPAA